MSQFKKYLEMIQESTITQKVFQINELKKNKQLRDLIITFSIGGKKDNEIKTNVETFKKEIEKVKNLNDKEKIIVLAKQELSNNYLLLRFYLY